MLFKDRRDDDTRDPWQKHKKDWGGLDPSGSSVAIPFLASDGGGDGGRWPFKRTVGTTNVLCASLGNVESDDFELFEHACHFLSLTVVSELDLKCTLYVYIEIQKKFVLYLNEIFDNCLKKYL